MESSPTATADNHPADAILPKIAAAFDLLTDLHTALRRPDVPTAAQEHVAAATRELASVQRLFERRGTR